MQRLEVLEADNRVLHARFGMTQTRDIRHAVDEIEAHISAQLADPLETKRTVEIKLDTMLKTLTEMMNS